MVIEVCGLRRDAGGREDSDGSRIAEQIENLAFLLRVIGTAGHQDVYKRQELDWSRRSGLSCSRKARGVRLYQWVMVPQSSRWMRSRSVA